MARIVKNYFSYTRSRFVWRRKPYVTDKKFTALVFMPQSSQPSVSVASTIVYAPPHSKRFYYSNEQKVKIDEEVEKCPDVSCYLADPEDLLIVPTKIDPAVANFYEVIFWPSIDYQL